MKNINLKNSLYVILATSVLTFFIILSVLKLDITLINTLRILPRVVTIEAILVSLFCTYLWKFKIFRGWLVPFPNLHGTWQGEIHSTWVDPVTNQRPAPIPAILTIKQSFLKMSCVMRTGEMTSRSCIADFIIDKENQLCRLCYTYDSTPLQTVRERSPQHCGTMLFDIVGEDEKRLHGEYWTGRKTTGHIEMKFWKKKLHDRYPEALGAHPVSSIRNHQS